jgi:hypothetical protein
MSVGSSACLITRRAGGCSLASSCGTSLCHEFRQSPFAFCRAHLREWCANLHGILHMLRPVCYSASASRSHAGSAEWPSSGRDVLT